MIMYAKYHGLVYSAHNNEQHPEQVELITTFADCGFTLDESCSNSKKTIYTKVVDRNECEAFYERKIIVSYKRMEFELYNGDLRNRDALTGSTYIITNSLEIADGQKFEKIDRFIYGKKIRLKEIDYIKVTTIQNEQTDECVVNKDNLALWIKANVERIP